MPTVSMLFVENFRNVFSLWQLDFNINFYFHLSFLMYVNRRYSKHL